jgi:hypothetical protein
MPVSSRSDPPARHVEQHMPKPPPSTVVALPFRTHLRPQGSINPQDALERMGTQAKAMLEALCMRQVACSGGWPEAADDPLNSTWRRALVLHALADWSLPRRHRDRS